MIGDHSSILLSILEGSYQQPYIKLIVPYITSCTKKRKRFLGIYDYIDTATKKTQRLRHYGKDSVEPKVIQQDGFLGNGPLNLFNEQELLTHLNLPTDIKKFNDDLDWQTANFDQSLPDA